MFSAATLVIACVAWRFWLGALSNKGGRGQRNREEIASRANFAAWPLVRPARQNRHATQATLVILDCSGKIKSSSPLLIT